MDALARFRVDVFMSPLIPCDHALPLQDVQKAVSVVLVGCRKHTTKKTHVFMCCHPLRCTRTRQFWWTPQSAPESRFPCPLMCLCTAIPRMYENKAVPVDAPERFRVEVSMSPGAAFNPILTLPENHDHTLGTVPRVQLNLGMAEALSHVSGSRGSSGTIAEST